MAYLLNTTVTGNLVVSENITTGNLYIGSTLLANSVGNTVDVYANSGSLQAASRLNFNNTSSVSVTISAGIGGNANVQFTSASISILTVTPSTSQTDYNPAGLSSASELRVNPSATIAINSLQAQSDGFEILLSNSSTDYLVILSPENTVATAANRFKLPKGFPAFLMPGDSIKLVYNGTLSRWIVRSWANQGQAMGLTFFTDFLEGTTGGTTSTVSGTGAATQVSTYLVNVTEEPVGATQLTTGTTTTGRATLGNAGTAQIVPTTCAALHVARLAVETTVTAAQTFQVFTGFIDSAGGTATDGIVWNNRWTGAVAEWSLDRFAAGTATRTTSGLTLDNNYNWYIIFINPAWTRADYISSPDGQTFTVSGSPTTGFPSSTQFTAWVAASMIKSVGTTARTATIDFAGYRVDGVRG